MESYEKEFDDYMLYNSDWSDFGIRRKGSSEVYATDRTISPKEKGYSGIDIIGGDIQWEYQTKLRNLSDRMQVWKEMRSDGSVDLALKLIELPTRGQRSIIVPYSDKPFDLLLADIVRSQLLDSNNKYSMNYNFLDHLTEETLSYQYGFIPFELVQYKGDWISEDGSKKIEGIWLLKKLAVRHPTSIEGWLTKKGSVGIAGIKQKAPYGSDIIINNSIEILLENLIIYVNDKVGDNWEGISILRPVFKHWTYKEGLYKIEAIGLQKTAMTIPVFKIRSPSKERINEAQRMIRSVMVHEEAGFVLNSEREEVDVLTGGIKDVAIHRAISHHDSKILQNVLAGFMLLGQESRGGARNLGSSLIEFFQVMMQSKINKSTQTRNRYLIRKLIDPNFTDVRHYPYIEAFSASVRDKQLMASILSTLADKSMIDITDEKVSKYIYDVFGIPHSEEVHKASKKEEDKSVKDQEIEDETEFSIRETFPAAKNKDNFIKFRNKWIKKLRAIVDMQKSEISKQVSTLLKKGVVPNINYLETPYIGIYNKLVGEYFNRYSEECPNFPVNSAQIKIVQDSHIMEVKYSILKGIINISRECGEL